MGDAGYSSLISPDQCTFRIGPVEGGFNTGKMAFVYRLTQRGPDKETMAALPLAFTLTSDNLTPPHILLTPYQLLSLSWSLEIVSASRPVCAYAL